MPNGYQELYKPTLTGALQPLPSTAYGQYGGNFLSASKGYGSPFRYGYGATGGTPDPVYKAPDWGAHFTPEGQPIYQQTGQTLSELLDRQRRMQEVGGFAGGSLGQNIADLQRQQTAQQEAFRQFSTAHNLFPYTAHYTAEGVPIHQQTEQGLQDLIGRKQQLSAVGGYFGQLDQQIAQAQQDVAAQKQALERAQGIYQAGGESAWKQQVEAWRKSFEEPEDYGTP